MTQDNFSPDSNLKNSVQKLHRLTVYSRWLLVLASWLTLGVFAIWRLWGEFELWRENFTWTAVRFALVYNRLAAISLGWCVGLTTAVLIWQSRNILFGLPDDERRRLEQRVKKIRSAGPTHPLWKWIS